MTEIVTNIYHCDAFKITRRKPYRELFDMLGVISMKYDGDDIVILWGWLDCGIEIGRGASVNAAVESAWRNYQVATESNRQKYFKKSQINLAIGEGYELSKESESV